MKIMIIMILLILLIIGLHHPIFTQGQITITSYPRPLFVKIGASFLLSCDYNSYTFHSWVHPTLGEVTRSRGRLELTYIMSIHTATLNVHSVSFEDQGVYTCRATTDSNIILNQTISAIVFEGVQIITESMLTYEARLCETVILNCTALHHDSIMWHIMLTHGHMYIPRLVTDTSDGRISVSSENGQLVIHDAKQSDNGTYLCTVSNRVSYEEITAYLNIIDSEVPLELLPHATPIDIDDTAINFTEISFSWDLAISHQCSDVIYRINATNCGTCPVNTTLTSATCSIAQNEFGNDSCIFAVQTLIHGSTVGHQTILSVIKFTDLIKEFVNIEFNQTASSIECNFHNQQENTLTSCSAVFGPGQECSNLSQSSNENSTIATNNSVIIHLNIEHGTNDSNPYCFHVTATNGSLTVTTRRVFNISHSDADNITPVSSTARTVSCNPADLSDGTELDQTSSNTLTCGLKSLLSLGIENGIVCYTGNNAGAVAVYSCLSCRFTGSSYETFIRMCTENGNWTGTTPQCADCSGYFIGVTTLDLGISLGSVLLVLLTMAFAVAVLSVALYRARAKLQGMLRTPAAVAQRLDQDLVVYEEVNIHRECPVDVDTQPNISYATHRRL